MKPVKDSTKSNEQHNNSNKKVQKSNNSIIDRFKKKPKNNNHINSQVKNNNNNQHNNNQHNNKKFKEIKKKEPIHISTLSDKDRDLLKRKKDLKILEDNKLLMGKENNELQKLLEKYNLKSKIGETILNELSIKIKKTYESVKCYRDRTMILKRLDDVKQSRLLLSYGEISFKIFGSSSIQLALTHSDIDLVMTVEKGISKAYDQKNWIYKFAQVLRNYGFERVQTIAHAKVPIIKFFDPICDFYCDITLTQDSGNTMVVKEFCKLNPILPILIVFVKHWASKHNINDASIGTLSSYSITNMLIYILQIKGLLPSYKDIKDNIDSSSSSSSSPPSSPPSSSKKSELSEILIYFFKYFGFLFNYRNSMINIFDFKQDKKESSDPEEEKRFKRHRLTEYCSGQVQMVELTLQDNKDLFFIKDCVAGHNITRCIQRDKLNLIIKEFQKAYSNLIIGKLPF